MNHAERVAMVDRSRTDRQSHHSRRLGKRLGAQH